MIENKNIDEIISKLSFFHNKINNLNFIIFKNKKDKLELIERKCKEASKLIKEIRNI